MAGIRGFLSTRIGGLKKRLRAGAYGIYYRRDSGYQIPEKLKVNGHISPFQFSGRTTDRFVYEFNQICLYDCYGLKRLRQRASPVRVIVDIGANQGLFLIAARQVFPAARLSGYEPNEALRPFLEPNAAALRSAIHFEAVSASSGKVELDFGPTDLHTRTVRSDTGKVNAVSLMEVVSRAGGSIDILKLDCEGAEWELFEDRDAWKHIKSVTMEYHLWARPGAAFEDVRRNLNNLNFKLIGHDPLDQAFGMLTAIRRES